MKINEISELAITKLMSELKDDLGKISPNNDLTSSVLLPSTLECKAIISNREKIILCGQKFIKKFLQTKFPMLTFSSNYKDGCNLKKNSVIFEISGNARYILLIERTVLNFIQHLSSISTYTKKFVEKIKKTETKLLDTRKTTTGLRLLEKYATKIGGAQNHRAGLYEKILIKDNHVKLLGGMNRTLEMIKKKKIKNYMIECESYLEVEKCLAFGSKYILLDNMTPDEITKCVDHRNLINKNVIFEITGGINLDNIYSFAKLGCEFISCSKITNSAKSVDIGLDLL